MKTHLMFSFASSSKRHHYVLLMLFTIFLGACGGNNPQEPNEVEEPPPIQAEETPTDSVQAVSEFEGTSLTLTTEFSDVAVQWTQISGHPVTLDSSTLTSFTIDLPWIIDPQVELQIEASATINATVVKKRFDVSILDRRFIIINAQDQLTETSDLFINYISANDIDKVPTQETIQLSSLAQGQRACAPKVSPNGRYVAFSVIEEPEQFRPLCNGLYVVDISTQIVRNVSKRSRDNQQIEINSFSWSPDGLKIAYRGNHGEALDQYYVTYIEDGITSYLNYLTGSALFTNWPSEASFPVEDGGNPYSLVDANGVLGFSSMWLANSEGFYFSVSDNESANQIMYQASIHGNVRKLERGLTIGESLSIADDEARDEYNERLRDCPEGGTCTLVGLPPIFTEPRNIDLINPQKVQSSVNGYLMAQARMIKNDDTSETVLAVRKPVIGSETAGPITNIDALDVFDAAWSPVANHLAFASGFDIRHKHVEDAVPLNVLTGRDVPGQLYMYQDYAIDHRESQERLSNPQPNIDENYVRQIAWSQDGQHIAYARGERNVEGPYYTSMWITLVDNVRDESSATIDANTRLLVNLYADNVYATDFMISPNGNHVVVLQRSVDGQRVTFINTESQQSSESDILRSPIDFWLSALEASFSPDGRYFAYLDKELIGMTEVDALYIKDLNGGNPVRINADLQSGERISQQTIIWSPYGDAVIYSVRSTGNPPRYFLAKVNGEIQALEAFLHASYDIKGIIVK